MNKEEVINELQAMKCSIAIVRCDTAGIVWNGVVHYPEENFLVCLHDNPNKSKLNTYKHLNVYNSIDDFNERVLYGKQAAYESNYRYYVNNFISVRPFKGDF